MSVIWNYLYYGILLTTVVKCPGLAPLTCVGNETTMVPTNLTEMRGDL